MKTKEELTALKAEVETLNKKLAELTEEELEQVSGGIVGPDYVIFRTGGELPFDAAGQTGKFGTGFIGTKLLSD